MTSIPSFLNLFSAVLYHIFVTVKSKRTEFPDSVHVSRQIAAFFARQNHQNAALFFRKTSTFFTKTHAKVAVFRLLRYKNIDYRYCMCYNGHKIQDNRLLQNIHISAQRQGVSFMMQTFDESAWYTIAAKVSGKVIEAENASDENGAAVCLAEATGADQQLWSITHIDGKYYKIANKKSGKVLDIISLGVVNGANLHQWEYVNGDSQLWFFEEKADGAVAIKSAMSAKCIDIVGMNAEADGAHLQIWVDVDGDNQSWFIREAQAEAPKAEEAKTEEPKEAAVEAPKTEEAKTEEPKAEEKTEEAPAKKTTTRKRAASTTTRKTAAKKTNESRAKRKRRTKAEMAADAAAAPAKKTTTRTRKTAAKKTAAEAPKAEASKTAETK